MKLRNFKKNTKAISPVIATLLMIAVAVVASLVAYAWVMGYIGGQTAKTGNAIQIQSVAGEGGFVTVYVQNVGEGTVTLNGQSVYVNNAQSIITINPASGEILAGQTAKITTNFGTPSATTITVKVVTTSGTFSEVQKIFP